MRWKLGLSVIAAACVTVDLRCARDALRPMVTPSQEEAVGSLAHMPWTVFWNQSHIGFVHVTENSFSLRWIHALQEITPAPQCFRLTAVGQAKTRQLDKKRGRF